MTADRRALRALLPAGERLLGVDPLHGDGSERRFSRVVTAAGTYILMAGPDLGENEAYARLARHLAARGVRVPRVLARDDRRGWLLLEDLGDELLSRRLAALAAAGEGDDARVALYEPVLAELARLQVEGARGFDLAVGFADAPYGPALMVEEEGRYFLREFAAGLAGFDVEEAPLVEELRALALRARAA